MEMKFNIDDKIYILIPSRYGYFVSEGNVIGIQIYKDKETRYIIENVICGIANEQDCFTTKEEAQKECDKRNRKV